MPESKSLRIAVATAGRFHVLDLARELSALGHHVRFYSYVPPSRAERFGLARRLQAPVVAAAAPFIAWERLARSVAPKVREQAFYWALNQAIIARLEPCDVFIGMSGIILEAALHARRRFGARIVLERGSKHILAQDEILSALPGAERPSRKAVDRELAGYRAADAIATLSQHSAQSFERYPEAAAKVFVNPLGVDLNMFSPRLRRSGGEAGSMATVLMVGTWSLQKGCDLLTQAVRETRGLRVLHVGALGDAPFPKNDPAFYHVGAVDQAKLPEFYAEADVLALPSRQDGFGMVLAQALAMGLPVICSDQTGGPDLCHTEALARRIDIVPAGDLAALSRSLRGVVSRFTKAIPLEPLAQSDRETLSWCNYAKRHEARLQELCAGCADIATDAARRSA